MKRSGNTMKDSLATFREYMRLERRRSAGLSPDEFRRWDTLRKRLDRDVGPLNGPGSSNQRATPRIPTSLKVSFDSLEKMGSVLMRNLSRGGIFVEIDPPPSIGTKLKLRIQVVDPPREIELDGEVASLHVGPRFEVNQRGVGIRFSSLSPGDQSLVDDLYEQQAERYLDAR
jgi:Tfp pilus assembly protein PilZ